MSEFTWTTDLPTVPGWYWIRGSVGGGRNIQRLNDWDFPIMGLAGCMFAGPIPEPAEPRPAPAAEPEQGASESA